MTEVAKVLKRTRTADLADNFKPGGDGDLADNFKPGGDGDLADNLKPGGDGDLADNLKPGGDGDLGEAAILQLVKAAAGMGQAKAIARTLRGVQGQLKGEDRAAVEKATNQLETAIAMIDDGYQQYVKAAKRLSRRQTQSGSNRTIHLHLHLGS
jgi:hypothetical protein